MQSSNLLKATSPGVITNSGTGVNANLTTGSTIHGGYATVTNAGPFGWGAVGANYTGTAVLSGDGTKSSALILGSSAPFLRFSVEPKQDGSVDMIFREFIDGVVNRAELDMESSVSPIEAVRINCLIAAMVSADTKPITYIRHHNLERHFRFSQA